MLVQNTLKKLIQVPLTSHLAHQRGEPVTKEHVKYLSQELANVATRPHYRDDAAIIVRTLHKFSCGGHSSSHSNTFHVHFHPHAT